MKPVRSLFVATVAVFSSTVAVAEEHRHHGAHVHGHAQLNLVVEGRVVEAELISPAVNLVGFEHPPRDGEERERVHEAVERLRDGGTLLGLPAAAACRQAAVEVESALMEDEHGHEAHGDHPEEARHQEEGEEHRHEGEEEGGHAEFAVTYRFECDRPEGLDHVTPALFDWFPGVEELEVQAVVPNGQRAAELSAGQREFRF